MKLVAKDLYDNTKPNLIQKPSLLSNEISEEVNRTQLTKVITTQLIEVIEAVQFKLKLMEITGKNKVAQEKTRGRKR